MLFSLRWSRPGSFAVLVTSDRQCHSSLRTQRPAVRQDGGSFAFVTCLGVIVFADAPALSDPPRTERSIGPAQGFAVGDLVEVLVELPDSHQPFGRMDCHNTVPLLDQLTHHFLVHDRRSD